MRSPTHHVRPLRRPAVNRLAATLVIAAAGVGASLVGTQPAQADSPWLTVSGGFASFSIPADYVRNTMGSPALLNVEGNFGPAANWSELGLSQFGNAWTATIGPLQPGAYYYRVSADDARVVVKDPTNPSIVSSQPAWSTFFVAGDSARQLADAPGGEAGTVESFGYRSPGSNQERSATAWTPPEYDPGRAQPYPVLYLQGEERGGARDWLELGRAQQVLQNLSAERRMAPMVVVMGDGSASESPDELAALVSAARRRYNIAHDGRGQAIAGASAGGSQALRAALAHPGEFAYVGSFSSPLSAPGVRLDARAINASTRLVRLYTGNVTDAAYNPTYRLMRALGQAGIRYDFDGVNPVVGHNWTAWQGDLIDFVPRLFHRVSDHRPSRGHLPLTREFTAPRAGTTPTPWLSRDAAGGTFVTVETGPDFAAAKHVTLWGNWAPGGAWLRVPLSLAGSRWRGTVGPLKGGFFYYQFIVDLVSKKDPGNSTQITSQPTWSTFLVGGKESRLLADVPAGRGGRIETLTYTSTVAGQERAAYVWTPPGYNPRRKVPYPVLYLQHGAGQSYTDWVEMGRAKQILDHEFLAGQLVPMVVVMGNGNVSDFPKELLDNIVPAARAQYNISHDPSGQALAGLSMGGFQTFAMLTSHPGVFGYVGTFSAGLGFPGAPVDPSGIDVAAVNQGTKLLRIYTGNVTDFVYPLVMSTLTTLDRIGIRYQFAGITPGPHGWDTWQKNLIDFAPRLFRDGADGGAGPTAR